MPIRALAALAFLGLSAGCANVAPYQRGRLAHPTMTASDDANAGRAHVHSVQEGAIGSIEDVASGCGCN